MIVRFDILTYVRSERLKLVNGTNLSTILTFFFFIFLSSGKGQHFSNMATFLLMVVVCFAAVSDTLAAAPSWSYDNSVKEPKLWGNVSQNCDGQSQSPIDIKSAYAEHDSGLGEFTLDNYNAILDGDNFTTENKGYTLQVGFPGFVYNVSGGGLPGKYTTVQFHLHWGSDNSKGSEHAVDSKLYPAEIHFVSFNTKYNNISTALKYWDGLAVLGVFLKVGSTVNAGYEKFLANSFLPMNADEKMYIPAFKFEPLLPRNKSAYFRYNGSLTTPTCNEVVTWTVFKEAVEVSQAQMDALRSLGSTNGGKIVNNYRPLQELHSRKVMSSFFIEKPTTVMTTETTDGPSAGAEAGIKISSAVMLLVMFSALFLH